MAYGYETYRGDTTVITSTERNRGIVFIETFSIPAGTSGNRSYAKVANGGLVYQVESDAAHTFSVDADASGSPRLNWTALGYNGNTNPSQVTVMASKLTPTADSYGIEVMNPNGDIIVSSDFPAPQYVGYVDINTTADSNSAVADGYTMYTHRASGSVSMAQGSNRLVVMGVPDSGSNDTFYCIDTAKVAAGLSYTPSVLVFTKTGSYPLPRLFVFAVDSPSQSGATYAIQAFAPSHSLLYDSGAENMGLMDWMNVSYASYGSTTTLVPSSGQATYTGITFPGCWWQQQSGSNYFGGYGAVKKVGGQFTFRLMQTYSQRPTTDENFRPSGDSTSNILSLLVDLTYLGYTVSSGTGGGTAQAAPVITSQTGNVDVTAGQTAQFSVTASGSPSPYYQWYRNGAPISGATGSVYSFTTVVGDSGATFYCIASNSLGSAQSTTETLTVTAASTFTPVSIAYGPSPTTATAGNTASFSVSVNGTSPITYQWYRTDSGFISGATGSSYSFTCSSADNGVGFYCIAYNGNGAYAAQSSAAQLTVNAAPVNAPVISQQPQPTVSATQGQVVYLTCVASPETEYDWYLNGSLFKFGSTIQVDTSTLGTFSYSCVVRNGTASTTSSPSTLTVSAPAATPYQRYYNFSTEVDSVDAPAGFSIFRNGSTSEIEDYWASGNGDGTLYVVRASGNFAPIAGSLAFNTTYDLANMAEAGWTAPGPTTTRAGASSTWTLSIDIYVKGGGVVATGNITLVSTNSNGNS